MSKTSSKLICRVKGGLGNQLFCYSAARRLSIVSNAELVLDNITGFSRDEYERSYSLNQFNIKARLADSTERMEPFERHRRWLIKSWYNQFAFHQRKYIEQRDLRFENHLLDFKVRGTVYIDGLWQSEEYFKDIEDIIRQDLTIKPPQNRCNLEMGSLINKSNSVAVHVRWFDTPGSNSVHNLTENYYQRAIRFVEDRIGLCHFYIFSDIPSEARKLLPINSEKYTIVECNNGESEAYADLWLMSQCKHFVTANSTFSWWGAWLSNNSKKIITTPAMRQNVIMKTNWGFDELIPANWVLI